jgi:hypothetical protein
MRAAFIAVFAAVFIFAIVGIGAVGNYAMRHIGVEHAGSLLTDRLAVSCNDRTVTMVGGIYSYQPGEYESGRANSGAIYSYDLRYRELGVIGAVGNPGRQIIPLGSSPKEFRQVYFPARYALQKECASQQ